MRNISDIVLPENVFVLDFETTGMDPKLCEPCELAIFNTPSGLTEYLIKPTKPIPAEVSAIHHITDANVMEAESWPHLKKFLADSFTFRTLKGTPPILVAHNADYDKTVLGLPDLTWICTYKCALVVWPDAPSHKNQVLRYHLELGEDRGRDYPQNAHTAGFDTIDTARLLQELLKHRSIEALIQISLLPAKLPKMPFGKHFGKKWADIDTGYLTWITKQGDMDEGVRNCAAQELASRR